MVNFTMLAHNRPRLTKQALESLSELDKTKANVTVWFDGDDAPTSRVLNEWVRKCKNKHQQVMFSWNNGEYGTGQLRNKVICLSERTFGRGDYLYLSDNDVYFTEGWLEKLIECYESAWEYGCRVIGGVGHPYHQPYEGIVKVGEYGVQAVHAQPLQSMLMKWEVWDKYGPFCSTPPGRVCQSEDIHFTNKLHLDGFCLGVVSPALVVNTGITNSFGEKIPGWELVKAQCPEGILCE